MNSAGLVLLVIVHTIVCLFLIAVVLLQQGKSADLAGAFGGQGSQTAFGPRGAANLLTKLTTYSAVLFMLTSIGLTVMMSRRSADHSVLGGTPTSQSSTPAKQ
jgi:preprotein translocase subunit SecG